jgi:serralysin
MVVFERPTVWSIELEQGEMFSMMKRAVVGLVLVVGVCLAVAVEPALAAPADLVRSFGRNGVTELPVPLSEQVHANDVAGAPDGGLYVLRTNYGYGTFGGARIERLRPNGLPNRAFGGNGSIVVPGGGISVIGGSSLSAAPDGKVIVAESSYLTRVNPDGSLDRTFAKGGFLDSKTSITAFAIQHDGRIVIAADAGINGSPTLQLSRYLPSGEPDPSFGGGAPVSTDVQTGQAGIALLGGDGLAVAGNPCCFSREPRGCCDSSATAPPTRVLAKVG